MAAATPATNKWLLTKQAAVAPSGSRRNDGNSESERERGCGGAGTQLLRGVEVIPHHHHPRQKAWGRGGSEGRARWADGWWQGWWWEWVGVGAGGVVWSGLSAVGQLSAPLSSLRSVSHTIYLAVKRPAALRSPTRPPSRIHPPHTHTPAPQSRPQPTPPAPPPHPAFVFCISLVTVQALRRLCC